MVGGFCGMLLRDSQDLLSDEKTPYERRFGMPFHGQVIPFGAMVEYHPISAKDLSRLQQFGPNVLPGIFLGYASYAGESGKETLWYVTSPHARQPTTIAPLPFVDDVVIRVVDPWQVTSGPFS